MKILIATGLYPPEIGGPATHVAVLERELPKKNIEFVTVPFSRVRSLPKVVRHLAYTIALLRSARGVSLVYALDPVSVGLPALIVAKLMRKPLILRVVGDYAWEQGTARFGVSVFLDQFVGEIGKQPLVVRLFSFIERSVAKKSALVIVPSEYLKKIVLVWGVEETSIRVVYNAFTPITTTDDRAAIRAKLGFSGKVIASAGRLVPWKGFRTLIDVIAELRKEHRDISCIIMGDGPDLTTLVAHAKERGVSESVHFLGRKERNDLLLHISGADVFVLNTAYEGLSHQLLEVMALGTPIVTTAVGGNGELIEHDKDGVLVPFDDRAALVAALTLLITQPEKGRVFSEHAHAKVASFTTERMVNGVVEVFTGVASR